MTPDPRIQGHRTEHRGGVSPDGLSDIGDLVDEAELRGEEAIRGVLGQLRAPSAHPEQGNRTLRARASRKILSVDDPPIQLLDHPPRLRRPAADDTIGKDRVM